MYENLGNHWATSLIAFLSILLIRMYLRKKICDLLNRLRLWLTFSRAFSSCALSVFDLLQRSHTYSFSVAVPSVSSLHTPASTLMMTRTSHIERFPIVYRSLPWMYACFPPPPPPPPYPHASKS